MSTPRTAPDRTARFPGAAGIAQDQGIADADAWLTRGDLTADEHENVTATLLSAPFLDPRGPRESFQNALREATGERPGRVEIVPYWFAPGPLATASHAAAGTNALATNGEPRAASGYAVNVKGETVAFLALDRTRHALRVMHEAGSYYIAVEPRENAPPENDPRQRAVGDAVAAEPALQYGSVYNANGYGYLGTYQRPHRAPSHRLRNVIAAAQRAAVFTSGEIESAIAAIRRGDGEHGGAEAVACFGGPLAVIRHAVRLRHTYDGWKREHAARAPLALAAEDAPAYDASAPADAPTILSGIPAIEHPDATDEDLAYINENAPGLPYSAYIAEHFPEGLTKPSDEGTVYWKGETVEHYTYGNAPERRIKEVRAAQELATICRALNRQDVVATTATVFRFRETGGIVNASNAPLTLTCCSCTGEAPALARWRGRDAGYGVCRACALKHIDKYGTEDARRAYGYEGVHWAAPDADEDPAIPEWIAFNRTRRKADIDAFRTHAASPLAYFTRGAVGSWQRNTPEGFVGVVALPGFLLNWSPRRRHDDWATVKALTRSYFIRRSDYYEDPDAHRFAFPSATGYRITERDTLTHLHLCATSLAYEA